MRKAPTAEQKAAAAARRERFKELAAVISAMSPEERTAIAMRAGIHTIEGRPLSHHNQCLLVSQNDRVSVVGGFLQWQRVGRKVKKGEKGLSIWVPIQFGRKDGDATGAQVGETGEEGKRGFIMGTVFDVSQTEPAEVAAELETAC